MGVPNNYYIQSATITYTGTGYGLIHRTGLWDSIVSPLMGILGVNKTVAASVDQSDGLLVFPAGKKDVCCAGTVKLPHRWLAGSTISPHIHALASPSVNPGTDGKNKVSLLFEYKLYDANHEQEPAEFTNATVNITLPALGPAGMPYATRVDLGDIPMSGYAHESVVIWRLTRLSKTGGLNDTYPGDFRMVSFMTNVRVNKLGSVNKDGDAEEVTYV